MLQALFSEWLESPEDVRVNSDLGPESKSSLGAAPRSSYPACAAARDATVARMPNADSRRFAFGSGGYRSMFCGDPGYLPRSYGVAMRGLPRGPGCAPTR